MLANGLTASTVDRSTDILKRALTIEIFIICEEQKEKTSGASKAENVGDQN